MSDRKQVFPAMLHAIDRAPSAHDSKPWSVSNNDFELTLCPRLTDQLLVADPHARELYISLGCALENACVVAQHMGYDPVCTYNQSTWPCAHVKLLPGRLPVDSTLFNALWHRHTDRGSYSSQQLSGDNMRLLSTCADDSVEVVLVTDQQMRGKIASLIVQGDQQQFRDPAYRVELSHWINRGLLGYSRLKSQLVSRLIKQFNIGWFVSRSDANLVRNAPLFCVLTTSVSAPREWINVGRVFERIALQATAASLRIQPMNQGLIEVESQRMALEKLLQLKGSAQFACRVGS